MKWPIFALAVIAILAVFFLAITQLSGPPANPNHSSKNSSANEHPEPPGGESQPAETWGQRIARLWSRTWVDPVAFFTLVLALFTGLLVCISTIQIGFLIKADRTSEKSADAAQKAAEVAETPLCRFADAPLDFRTGQLVRMETAPARQTSASILAMIAWYSFLDMPTNLELNVRASARTRR